MHWIDKKTIIQTINKDKKKLKSDLLGKPKNSIIGFTLLNLEVWCLLVQMVPYDHTIAWNQFRSGLALWKPAIWASEGPKFQIFKKRILGRRIMQDGCRKDPKAPPAPEWPQELAYRISRGCVKRRALYGQIRPKHVLLIKVFYTRS